MGGTNLGPVSVAYDGGTIFSRLLNRARGELNGGGGKSGGGGAKYGGGLSSHILDAAVLTTVKASVDHGRSTACYACGGHSRIAGHWTGPKVSLEDYTLLHDTLRHLATHDPPHKPSSPRLGDWDTATIELAGRGLGPVGSVQVLDNLWARWADPHFQQVGEKAPAA